MSDCFVCGRLAEMRTGTNPFFVAELETGYAVLGDFQYFKGYTLFLAKDHLTELHQLPAERRWLFLKEMSLVAEAVHAAIQPAKMNYELLGNSESHLHWHLFPRQKDELAAHKGPIWWVPAAERNGEAARPSVEGPRLRRSVPRSSASVGSRDTRSSGKRAGSAAGTRRRLPRAGRRPVACVLHFSLDLGNI